MRRYRQGLTVGADKYAMARAFLTPFDLLLLCNRLQLFNSPVERVVAHRFE